jgi:2'-5' RNA ligase
VDVPKAPPLIVTLQLEAAAFERLNALRTEHFPPERNFLPAHITLFHALPGNEEEAVAAEIERMCARQAPFGLTLPRVRFLGRGVALEIESPELQTLRQGLAKAWDAWLTTQDRQKFRPHVTVQNKVEPEVARRLFEDLQASWTGLSARAEGLLLWRYLGGPWSLRRTFRFAEKP